MTWDGQLAGPQYAHACKRASAILYDTVVDVVAGRRTVHFWSSDTVLLLAIYIYIYTFMEFIIKESYIAQRGMTSTT